MKDLICSELERQGALEEVANVFDNEKQARALLGKIGFPKNRIPNFGMPLDFWQDVCSEMEKGLTPEGPCSIITAASDTYPHNTVFERIIRDNSESETDGPDGQSALSLPSSPQTADRNQSTVIISVTGFEDPIEILDASRELASTLEVSGNVDLGLVNSEILYLQLDQGTVEDGARLSNALEGHYSGGTTEISATAFREDFRPYMIEHLVIRTPNQRHELNDVPASSQTIGFINSDEEDFSPPDRPDLHGRPPIMERAQRGGVLQPLKPNASLHQNGIGEGEEILVTPNHESYAIRSMSVEGPDQQRFELSDVPASTPLKDIARATMSEYDDKMWPQDQSGHARPAVVDKINPDGTSSRLNPDSTVHGNRIRTGDSLQVSPQSTAGGVNPLIREEALSRVCAQIMAFKKSHPGFSVSANAIIAPTEYLLKFQANGWGPPSLPVDQGGQPHQVDAHEVFLRLPPDFPMVAPQAFWQTPIFHPNIHPNNQSVCLGVLDDQYTPGMDFGRLCQLLVDIASYQNYEVRSYYNDEATKWALSPDGIAAIESRGGESILHWIKGIIEHEELPGPSLKIRRCD